MENIQNKNTLLLVDDDAVLSENVLSFFKDKNFEVYSSNNGIECIDLIKNKDPDVILLDVMLPGQTGIEVIKQLSGEDPSILKKIILMTNASDTKTISDAISFGVFQYFVKSDTSLEGIYEAVIQKIKEI